MIAHAAEVERLLGKQRLPSERNGKKHRVKGRAQQMPENGEALKYIELVLRQLRRASRDHRQLLEQRHRVDVEQPREVGSWSFTSPRGRSVRGGDDAARDFWEKPQRASREVRATEQPRELTEFPGPEVVTKLLAKRKTYAGGGVNVLETMPRRMSLDCPQGLRYGPVYEGIDAMIIR